MLAICLSLHDDCFQSCSFCQGSISLSANVHVRLFDFFVLFWVFFEGWCAWFTEQIHLSSMSHIHDLEAYQLSFGTAGGFHSIFPWHDSFSLIACFTVSEQGMFILACTFNGCRHCFSSGTAYRLDSLESVRKLTLVSCHTDPHCL